MCGIIAYIGKRDSFEILINGLKILQNRGYDSTGIATIKNKKIILSKYSSRNTSDALKKLEEDSDIHKNTNIGIGHTRWATHGEKNKINAHPHFDENKRIFIVHNGVIENYSSLKDKLKKSGIKFISETDSEVIAQLIGYYSKNMNILDAVKKCTNELEGTWGIVVLDRENPKQLIAARKGSPILIGIGKGETFISSEASSFVNYTKHFISLNNNEIVRISENMNDLDISRIEQSEIENIQTDPYPYTHWTLKEIHEQPLTIQNSLNNGGRIYDFDKVKLGGLDGNREKLLSIRNLIISGCGTSYYAALYGAKLFRSLGIFDTVQVVDSSEFDINYIHAKNMGLLVLSQSGETNDVLKCLEISQNSNIVPFSIINRVGSLISRTTKCGVYLNAGRENGVASTKSFTSQVVVLTLVGIWFSQHISTHVDMRKNLVDNLLKLSLCYSSTLRSIDNTCDIISQYLLKHSSCFILGKGLSEPIAKEAALKIKELTYIHAEGYPAGSLKHGPFALIEKGTPIFIILMNDIHKSYMETTIHEVKSRGAHSIVISNTTLSHQLEKLIDILLYIPDNGQLSSLISIIPFQLIAYKLAILKKLNPDKPRNLAKTVTVI